MNCAPRSAPWRMSFTNWRSPRRVWSDSRAQPLLPVPIASRGTLSPVRPRGTRAVAPDGAGAPGAGDCPGAADAPTGGGLDGDAEGAAAALPPGAGLHAHAAGPASNAREPT